MKCFFFHNYTKLIPTGTWFSAEDYVRDSLGKPLQYQLFKTACTKCGKELPWTYRVYMPVYQILENLK